MWNPQILYTISDADLRCITIPFMANIHLKRTDSTDPDFAALAQKLTVFLAELNGEADAFYAQYNKSDTIRHVVVAYSNEEPVGCGAFRPMSETNVEIKRMYVDPAQRGNGIGAQILAELESWSREEGYQDAVLETSRRLTPAVHLYQKSGYEFIPNYPPYEEAVDSVCMQKSLV